ncbi:MAG TPA: energy-converting hydrogenase B subunit J [Methanobacterium sp.]|nr:energy-converting hydrogenase B subunit J [Methanobacterium sp.]
MIYAGPLILGFLLGFILGSRIKFNLNSGLNFTTGSYIIIFVTAVIAAYLIGPFPYYVDAPLASGFVSGVIGIFIGKLILGRDVKENEEEIKENTDK